MAKPSLVQAGSDTIPLQDLTASFAQRFGPLIIMPILKAFDQNQTNFVRQKVS
jgi:hypothetical protein